MSLRGVRSTLVKAFRVARAHVKKNYPGVDLRVTSGYRSPAYQRQLRARWDRGNRGGLVYRPALVSRHSTGRAIDIGFVIRGRPVPVASIPAISWAYVGALMERQGVTWGGRWSPPDLPHFEV